MRPVKQPIQAKELIMKYDAVNLKNKATNDKVFNFQ